MVSNKYLSLFVVGGLLLFSGCGKVTQEVVQKEDQKENIFSIRFKVQVMPTANLDVLMKEDENYPVRNVMTPESEQIYVDISGIQNGEGYTQLSWGKGLLFQKPKADENESLRVWTSKATNKEDITIEKPNLNETYLVFSTPTQNRHEWISNSEKIRLVYPLYRVSAFANQDQYYLAYVSTQNVTQNALVDLGTMDHYDTFIAILYDIQLENADFQTEKLIPLPDLKELYTRPFFDALRYHIPRNQVSRFLIETPRFVIDRPLENELTNMIDLYLETNAEEVLKYIKRQKTLSFSKKAKNILIKTLEKKIEAEKD